MRSLVMQEDCPVLRPYGAVQVTLRPYLENKKITRHRLAVLTGSKYEHINRYYKGESVERVSLDLMARICYVLECDIGDLLLYRRP